MTDMSEAQMRNISKAQVEALTILRQKTLIEKELEACEASLSEMPKAHLRGEYALNAVLGDGGALAALEEIERTEERKAAKIDNFAARAITDLEPYFTGSHGDRETMYALAKYVQALCQQTGVPLTDQRILKVIEVGDKAMAKKQAIESATSEELEGISWT